MILGKIARRINGTGATVIIDGEETATEKPYLWLSSYFPMVGDRVLIEEISGQYVIIGSVTNDPTISTLARLSANRIGSPDSGYVGFGIKNGDLYYGLAPYDGSSFTMYKVAKG